jgi:hypothetical protein
MAFKIDNEVLREYVTSVRAVVKPNTLRLFGVRGAVPHGKDSLSLQENRLNAWNDTIGIWGSDFAIYKGTVDPGLDYTVHPQNDQGAAHLVPLGEPEGEVWTFKWGMHKNQYEALVQAETFKVRRDRDRDGIAESYEPLDAGDFGIHIHWGGDKEAVGAWSAGCQVLWGRNGEESPWVDFKRRLKKSGQTTFDYFLIDGARLVNHLGL